jgi:hypothetical protein
VELHTNAVNTGVETPASDPGHQAISFDSLQRRLLAPGQSAVPAVTFWILGFVSRGTHALSSNAGWRPAHSEASWSRARYWLRFHRRCSVLCARPVLRPL